MLLMCLCVCFDLSVFDLLVCIFLGGSDLSCVCFILYVFCMYDLISEQISLCSHTDHTGLKLIPQSRLSWTLHDSTATTRTCLDYR